MQGKVLEDWRSLPPHAQQQVADFVALLTEHYQSRTRKHASSIDWDDEPFVGMWADRTEMQDSTEWVREARHREWGSGG